MTEGQIARSLPRSSTAHGSAPSLRLRRSEMKAFAYFFAINFIVIAVSASVAVEITAGASGAQKGE